MMNIIEIPTPPGGPVCDFCSHQPVTARYHAKDFEIKSVLGEMPIHQASMGDWAACSECEKFIDADDWEGIVARAVVSFFDKYPELRTCLTEAQRKDLKEDFWYLYRQLRENGCTKVFV